MYNIRPLALLLAAMALPSSLRAVQINLTYDTAGQAGSVPTNDSDGSRLMAIARAAANYWEDIIEDPHTLNLQVRYDNSISGIGKWTESSESGGRATAGAISFRGTTSWYYDPTPNNHDEYDLAQTLVRDLTTTAFNNTYAGSPPQVLEFSFTGTAAAGAPAAVLNATDLYSVALHEICHALGMSAQLSTAATEISDNDYDIFPSLANGAVFDVLVNTNGGAHTICSECLMTPGIPQERRRLPSATDILALATCPDPGWTDIDLPRQDFLPGGTSDWNTPGNWVGNQVPGRFDDAFCRHGVEFGSRFVQLSAPASAANLLVTSATAVRTNAYKLDIGGTVTIAHDGSLSDPRISVMEGGELEALALAVGGGELDMVGGTTDVQELTIRPGDGGERGELTGFGIVDVRDRLTNDGRIAATDLAPRTLSFISAASAPWDLDGAGGNGEVFANTGNLNFSSGGLTDSFDGLMQIADPNTLNITAPWTLGSGGKVDLNGGASAFAKLTGGVITASGGEFECSLACLVTAPVNFSGSFKLNLLGGGELEMDAFTTYGGGTFVLGNNSLFELDGGSVFEGGSFFLTDGATLRTDGTANLNGGTFNIGKGARLDLAGTHVLRGGTFTGNGTVYFGGPTTIAEAVTIACDVLDLDGSGLASKQLTLNNDLTVQSASIDGSGAVNTFDGTLNFGPNSGLNSAELRIEGPATWTMAGVMNTNTGSTFTLPSISGVPFTMSGTTNVNGSTRWDAVGTITGTVEIPSADQTFALLGGGPANPNRLVNGAINGPGKLRAVGTANLVGHGYISANIDFVGGESPGGAETRLLADDGVLTLAGTFVNVPPVIGTADADGILIVTNPWTLTANDTLSLAGGVVGGATLTNNGTIRGSGTIESAGLNNESEISAADGATLTINTTGPVNLDGLDVSPTLAQHRINAIDGNLVVASPLLDPFDGTATIAAGRSMSFAEGWELGNRGVLHMNGGSSQAHEAALLGSSSVISNLLNIDGSCLIGSTLATFAPGAEVRFNDADSVLRLTGNGNIEAGATFTGPGRLVAAAGSSLGLRDGTDLDAAFVNEGSVVIASSPGRASLQSYTQSSSGRLSLVLAGRPGTSDWDEVTVNGPARLDGRLNILFRVPDAQIGDTWKILDTPSLSGGFTTYVVFNLPGGQILRKTEQATGVYLELVASDGTYLDWAAAEGIPPGSRAIDADHDNDLIENGLELFLGGDPNVPDSGLLPTPQRLAVDDTEFLSLTVVLPHTFTPSDVTLRATRSTGLAGWSTANVILHQSTTDPVTGVETRIYRSSVPYASLPAEFLRLEVGP